jgi:hypothetical protein
VEVDHVRSPTLSGARTAWADLVTTPPSGPTVAHTSALARRVAAELAAAGWRLERVLSDNGNEFGRRAFAAQLPAGIRHSQIRSGRTQTSRAP